MPFQQYRGAMRGLGIALYHMGRISVYAMLGVALHLFRGLFHPQWQQYFSVTAGILLLAVGIVYFLPQLGLKLRLPWTDAVVAGLGKAMQGRHPLWLIITGGLNGLLPCGMVYMAMAVAVSVPHTWQAAMVMYAFGVGTLPMMIGLTLIKGRISINLSVFRKWTPMLLLVFGALFVLRGANLGIPLLSPKAVIEHSGTKLDCCHRSH
jgi:sulfite exporter TauE/SafE